MKKYSLFFWLGGFILLAVLLKIFFFSPSNPALSQVKSPSSSPAMKLPAVVLSKVDVNEVIELPGEVVPVNQVSLFPEMSGKLIKYNFDQGRFVAKGTLIAELNNDEIKAQITRIEKLIENAEKVFVRQQKLKESGSTSEEEFDMAQTQVETYKADLAFQKAMLRKTQIYAPFDGVLSLKPNISVGSTVNNSTNLGEIIQTQPYYIDFEVPENYSTSVKENTEIEIWKNNTLIQKTKVSLVSPLVFAETRNFKARAIVNQKDLKPGNYVSVKINIILKDRIMIPTESVIPVMSGKRVFLIKDGKSKNVEIETGLRTSSTVEAMNNLNTGDTLIVQGIANLKPNTPVIGIIKPKK
ncbi:MAG: efflux RND transporter periplasmic adaptor subunit [Cytophagales bacterium]